MPPDGSTRQHVFLDDECRSDVGQQPPEKPAGGCIGHGGAVAGYGAALYINRDHKFAVIALANALGPKTVDTQELVLRCLDVVSKPKSPSH